MLGASSAGAIVLNDQAFQPGGPLESYGNIQNFYDSTNLYPNVAALRGSGGCTGSLINARTVLTAAHCFFAPGTTTFTAAQGDYVSFASIAKTPAADPVNGRFVTSVVTHAQYSFPDRDIAVISLDRPVTHIAPVNLLSPNATPPGAGTKIFMAGYGGYGTGSNPPSAFGPYDENRRYAESFLGEYGLSYSPNQLFYSAQFRNPASPNNPNDANLPQQPTLLEGGVAQGDSGGPLFALVNGVFTQIGVVQGGQNPTPGGQSNGYGEISGWTPVNLFADWIAQNNPLRSVSAAEGDFNWSNPAAWVDAVSGANNVVPNNTSGVVGNLQTDVARYYQVTLSNPGNVVLDVNTTVDTLSVSGQFTQLVLPAPFTLSTVLAAQLTNGAMTLAGGTLTAPEFLVSGGLLQGAGTINAAGGMLAVCNTGMCNTGGTVAPEGTITVNGNYTQSGTGTLLTRLFVNGTNDRLAVSGTATLGGRLIGGLESGLYGRSTTYRVLTAGSVANTFGSVTLQGTAFLRPEVTYSTTAVDVTVSRSAFGSVGGLTANQQAVGNALEGGYSTTLTGAASRFYQAVLNSNSAGGTLNQLSGAANGGTQTMAFAANSQTTGMLMDQVTAWRDGIDPAAAGGAPLAYAAQQASPKQQAGRDAFAAIGPARQRERTWRAWTAAFGGRQTLDGATFGASSDLTQSIGGGAIGADYQADRSLLLGFAAGGSSSSFSSSLGSGDASGGFLGLYGVKTFGPSYLAATLTYSRSDNTTTRTVAVGVPETITGRFSSDQLGGRIEFGHRFDFGPSRLTPFAALQFAKLWQPGYTESSVTAAGAPGLFGLAYQSQDATSLPTFLGLQADATVRFGGAVWSPFARVSWVHEWHPQTQLAASFVTVPGASFTVDGPRAAGDAVRLEGGGSVALTKSVALFGKLTGEYSHASQSFAGNGGIRFAW